MKPKLLFILTCLCALPCAMHADMAPRSSEPSVEVVFSNPEKFTDVKSTSMGTERDRDAILAQIKEYVTRVVADRVPAGHSLTVTFKDIDMAGDFEPWRVDAKDVRIVKDLYPPRIKLSFRLTDASGAVVKEGDRSLSDLTFMNLQTIDRTDELRFEKRLLADWASGEFSKVKGS